MIARAAAAVAGANKAIRALIILAHVISADETPIRVGPGPRTRKGSCGCGADLAGAADLGVRYSRQVTGLPEARAVTTQYDRHQVQCGCGRVHVADAPPEAPGAPGTVTCGLSFQAWCVFLMVMHHVPMERCADIIEPMAGIRPSDGWVHTLLERAARAVAAANRAIRALIILARVTSGCPTSLQSARLLTSPRRNERGVVAIGGGNTP